MRDARIDKLRAQYFASMIRMLYKMSGPVGLDRGDAAREFGVSVRTVYRWLATLKLAGVPFQYDKYRRVYQTPVGWRPEQLGRW